MNMQPEIRGGKSKDRGRILFIVSILFLSGVFLLPSDAISANNNAVPIEETRTALEKWVETQRIISQEKRDLALAKEMLNERIELVQREIKSLHEKINRAENSIAEVDKKRLDMIKENDKLKEASTSLNSIIVTLEAGTKELLRRLPDPIRDRVKPLSQQLMVKPEQSKLSVAERFQNVVGILNEVNKFNQVITVTSEVRTMPDGTSAEVTAMYLGIGQAYYTDAKGTLAGLGAASDKGWVWKPANEAAAQIAQAIAIMKNEQVASYVELPVEIE